MVANHARRRTKPTARQVIRVAPVSQRHDETFQYSALQQDKDCIRVIHIRPAMTDDDPVSCTIREVAFGDRPKYQALSYVWGDETDKLSIILNGTEFRVTRNLFGALRFLRRKPDLGPFWIDAISINQQDIPERNRQLRIMPHIYSRAHTVLVWLGEQYSKYESVFMNETEDDRSQPAGQDESEDLSGSPKISAVVCDSPPTHTSLEYMSAEVAFEEEVRNDRYWSRVWIIQEIGKANRIRVCFGCHRIMSWKDFIEGISSNAMRARSGGPYRLNDQREKKYAGGHTLRKLLENHRDALCKDPRDKIYGLVGLAEDARGFPTDYGKSEIDVWKDTMQFMNLHGLLRGFNRIQIGRMVMGLLGIEMGLVQSVAHSDPHEARILINDAHKLGYPDVFDVRAHLYGYIQYLGPTTNGVVSSLEQADDWAMALQANFTTELGEAHRESDNLMLQILDANQASLARLCLNHTSNLNWRPDGYHESLLDPIITRYKSNIKSIQESKVLPQYNATSTLESDDDRFLIQIHELDGRKLPFKTGIASSQAQLGDLVCWIPGVTQAVLVRIGPDDDGIAGVCFHVCGTARMTCDIGSEVAVDDKRKDILKTKFDILMDADTLFVISAR